MKLATLGFFNLVVLGKQPKPFGIDVVKTGFYDNYIFRIKGKLIYVKWYRGNLTYRWNKREEYQDIYTLSVEDRVYIEQQIELARSK